MDKKFDNLLQFIQEFPSSEDCRKHFEQIRWDGKPVCPHCGSEKLYTLKRANQFKCGNKECYRHFNVLTGTIFENTKIPLRTWFLAIYIATNHKKGISSCQLARDLGITQKSAWFVLSRVREMLKSKAPFMLTKPTEIDETYVGGKSYNKHKKERAALKQGTGYINKTMVFGLLERGGNVHTRMVQGVTGKDLKPIIKQLVQPGATIVTDGFGAYAGLHPLYQHVIVNHEKNEWVKDIYHTNTLEGFWSQLKRGIYGIYHQVSPKHLHRYCSEFEFRYNTREQREGQRFNAALAQSHSRLKYHELIAKEA